MTRRQVLPKIILQTMHIQHCKVGRYDVHSTLVGAPSANAHQSHAVLAADASLALPKNPNLIDSPKDIHSADDPLDVGRPL